MWRRLWGWITGSPGAVRPAGDVSAAGRPAAPGPRRGPEPTRPAPLPPEAGAFLLGLVSPDPCTDLQRLPPDDRVFLAGLLKRLREDRFELPVLPRVALEMTRLVANPGSSAADYVRVLATDPALSVQLLRTANSVFYGFATPARGVLEAVIRVGLTQVRDLVLLSHLQGRVLQGGAFQQEALWLSDLSLALANVSRRLAPRLGLTAEAAFTRGLLLHLEQFAILGSVGDLSSEHRRPLKPSAAGAVEAFRRFGPAVRQRLIQGWDLAAPLGGGDGAAGGDLLALRAALVRAWTGGEPGADVPGVPPDLLADALARAMPAGGAPDPGTP